jgi:rhamnosyltransferase
MTPPSSSDPGQGPPPRVAVLLATHDGRPFLEEQLDSILGQRGVSVEVFASDDASTDGTWEILEARARAEPRLHLLPRGKTFGSAAPNFYHLLLSVDPRPFDAVAFADQDDVWYDWKLEHHMALLREKGVGGISSSVLAFWPDGREQVLEKAGAMRRLDHHFQSPGPGCTFLLRPDLVERVRSCLARPDTGAATYVFHDWLVYAIARDAGLGWHISERPSIRYRQHGSNEWGANRGLGALRRRMERLLDGSYGAWTSLLLHVTRCAAAATGAPPPPERISALEIALEGRRRLADRLLVAATHLRGIRARAPGPSGAAP